MIRSGALLYLWKSRSVLGEMRSGSLKMWISKKIYFHELHYLQHSYNWTIHLIIHISVAEYEYAYACMHFNTLLECTP
jgi:hypothetical protein